VEFVRLVDLVVQATRDNSSWLNNQIYEINEDGSRQEKRYRLKVKGAQGNIRDDWRFGPHSNFYQSSLADTARRINQALALHPDIQWFEDDVENQIVISARNQAATRALAQDMLRYATKHDCWCREHFWNDDGQTTNNIYLTEDAAATLLAQQPTNRPSRTASAPRQAPDEPAAAHPQGQKCPPVNTNISPKKKRKHNAVSAKQAAEQLVDVSESMVEHWENGRGNPPPDWPGLVDELAFSTFAARWNQNRKNKDKAQKINRAVAGGDTIDRAVKNAFDDD